MNSRVFLYTLIISILLVAPFQVHSFSIAKAKKAAIPATLTVGLGGAAYWYTLKKYPQQIKKMRNWAYAYPKISIALGATFGLASTVYLLFGDDLPQNNQNIDRNAGDAQMEVGDPGEPFERPINFSHITQRDDEGRIVCCECDQAVDGHLTQSCTHCNRDWCDNCIETNSWRYCPRCKENNVWRTIKW